jgi:DNA-binding response OmpR family regulator
MAYMDGLHFTARKLPISNQTETKSHESSSMIGATMLQRLFSNNKKTSDYTVLVVDDDRPVREAISDNLEEEGYIVVAAMNGEEALRLLDSIALPAAMIVDLMMPEMDGKEFVARARVRFGHHSLPPILLLTAARHGEVAANVIEVDDFMPKPFEVDDLLHRLSSLIEKRRPSA